MWERLFSTLMPKHSAHRTAVSLLHRGHTKADGLRPERREPGELSKAEWSSPNRRIEAQVAILSKASFLGLVCLSAVYSTDTESDATQFLWIPSMSGSQAFLSLLTAPTLSSTLRFPPGTWEAVRTPKKMCTVLQGSYLWDLMEVQAVPRQLESALEWHPSASFPKKKASKGPSLATGRAVHFSQIPSR